MTNKIIDINEATIINCLASLRPENIEIRAQIDIGYSFDGKVVILFEIRPDWFNPKEKQHNEFAKIRYYKSRKEWNLYWMLGTGKWEIYEPFPKSAFLDKIVEIIKEDKHACFFG